MHKMKFYFLTPFFAPALFRLAGYVQVIKQFSHWRNVSWLIMPELVSFMKICERGDWKSSNCGSRIADATCVRSMRVPWESKLDALTYKVSKRVTASLPSRNCAQTVERVVGKSKIPLNRWESEVARRLHIRRASSFNSTSLCYLSD
jgi:hypothetical protein